MELEPHLDITYSQRAELPENLFDTRQHITSFYCVYNKFTRLPRLPLHLESLDCNNNKLVELPILPVTLNHLNCSHNQLTHLPLLPNNITHLTCNHNQLTHLPPLPNHLTTFDCNTNELTEMPLLPDNITILQCHNNRLTILPNIPSQLHKLDCDDTMLPFIQTLSGVHGKMDIRIHSYNGLIQLYSISLDTIKDFIISYAGYREHDNLTTFGKIIGELNKIYKMSIKQNNQVLAQETEQYIEYVTNLKNKNINMAIEVEKVTRKYKMPEDMTRVMQEMLIEPSLMTGKTPTIKKRRTKVPVYEQVENKIQETQSAKTTQKLLRKKSKSIGGNKKKTRRRRN